MVVENSGFGAEAAAPIANYIPFTITGKLVVVSGQLPLRGSERELAGVVEQRAQTRARLRGLPGGDGALAATDLQDDGYPVLRQAAECGGPALVDVVAQSLEEAAAPVLRWIEMSRGPANSVVGSRSRYRLTRVKA